MKFSSRFLPIASTLLAALVSFSCGGGGGGDSAPAPSSSLPQLSGEAGAPPSTGTTASDGFAWINFRRSSAGLPALAPSSEITKAAQNHADYQRLNGPFSDGGANLPITHTESSGNPGFTGVNACPDRMAAAGFSFGPQYGCGETISAMSSASGFDAAEELIAAIYHRFIIFQPSFAEAGAGASVSYDGQYTLFTQNFAVRGSFASLGNGAIANYPYHSQKLVPTSFAHFTEHPDPLPVASYPQYAGKQVGYPISVHADLDQRIDVNTFTVHRRGSSTMLSGRILSGATDPNTEFHAAAIVPYQQLASNTVYDVAFSGTVCPKKGNTNACTSPAVPVSRTWSFTTR